ncbi:MAG: hypothetical protein WC873_02590 [Candidatus Gracilibacteria bacterium]
MKNKTKNKQYLVAEVAYENILDAMNLPKGDREYRAQIKEILRNKTVEHAFFAITQNMSDEEADEFEAFMIETFDQAPWISHEDLLVAYAAAQPKLLEKISKSLDKFFDRFIATFKTIRQNA